MDTYPRQYVEEKYRSFIKVSERIFTRYPNAEAGYGLNDDNEMRRMLENIPLYRQKIVECQRINVSLSRLTSVEVLDREYFKLNNARENLAARLPTFKARSEAVLAKEREALSYSARACSAPSPSAAKEDSGRAVQAAREAIENYRTLRNMFDWEKLKKQREDVARIDGDLRQLDRLEEEYRSAYNAANNVYHNKLQGVWTSTYFTEKRRKLDEFVRSLEADYQGLLDLLRPYRDQPWGLAMWNRVQRDYRIARKIRTDFPEERWEQHLYGRINVLLSPEGNGCPQPGRGKMCSSREIDVYNGYVREVQSIGQRSYALAKSAQDHAKRALECSGRMPEPKPARPSGTQRPPPSPPADSPGCRANEQKCGTWCCQRGVSCFDAYSMKMAISQGRCRTP